MSTTTTPIAAAGPDATTRHRRLRHLPNVLRGVFFGGLAVIGLGAIANAASAAPGVKAAIKKNVLTVTGTAGADVIRLRLQPGDPGRLQVDVGGDGTADFTFNRAQFTTIVVLGAGGDDTLVADHLNGAFTDTEATTLDGGGGSDTLLGSVGAEKFIGGSGADFVDGSQGLDTVSLGDDADTFQWDPGDSSDSVTGGAGTDVMTVNGANIGEIFDVARNGDRVRFARNIGSVVMDLDELEAINLNALGGNDLVNVSNVTGTDLATLNANFAGAGGIDDTVADSIEVPAGVTIGRDGTTPVVNGLGAQVRVVNPGTLDQIHATGLAAADAVTIAGTDGSDVIAGIANGTDAAIDGATPGMLVNLTGIETTNVALGAGNDQFSAVGNLAALTAFHVDGGADSDVLLGSNGNDTLNGGTGSDFADGQQGLDSVSLGDGDDSFQWDPGDSNDAIDGGSGTDTTIFNGSNIGEIFDISNSNTHVRLFRNIANITMDLDNVEALDLNTFGGNDTINVNDLTGTDLTKLAPNFALFGGGDDAVVDSVEVPAGVSIGRDGTTPVVNGLGAQVRVINAGAFDQIHATGPTGADAVTIAGTDANDTIAGIANGTDVAIDGATPGVLVNLTTIERVDVALGNGHDQFSAVGNLAALTTFHVDGGADNDTLLGSNGGDTIAGGPGSDFVDGQQGPDAIDLGGDADTFQWDPGDGNDTVTGGAGVDVMAFNGSNANEIFDIGRNGDRVRFARNVAAIVLDLDDLEAIYLKAFGGNDVVNPSDTTGTDLVTVTADLSAAGGVDDMLADSIEVPAGVTIGRDGTTPVVNGLGAPVRVVNPGTLDVIHATGLTAGDAITIAGTDGSDVIAGIANGTDVAVDGATPGMLVNLTGIETTNVELGAGNDQFSAVGNLAALTRFDVDGGADSDVLLGSNGNDTLDGGTGSDFADGQQGLDTVSLGDGDDSFQWDPGDSNDTIDGGTGADTTIFNGSNASELYDISNSNTHIRLFRNIANITMDLDNVESLDLNTFGGNDGVTVNDLTGTDLTSLTANLALFGGATDLVVDAVTINGTASDDAITVAADGTRVVTSGVGPSIRVAGADATLDGLTINGVAGDDTITAVPGVEALILLTLVP